MPDAAHAYAGQVGRTGLLVDCAIGLAVFAVVAVAITADLGGVRGPDAVAYLFAACLGALMLVRRTFPVLALVATAVGLCAYYTAGYPPIGLAIPVAAALYSAAEAGRLRAAILTATVLLVVSTGFRAVQGDESLAYLFAFELASTVGLLVAAITLGDSVRGRRLLRAEREREAARLVEEERLRIARDLHDVLVQRLYAAGMQLDLLARRPSRKLARKDATRLTEAIDQLDASIEDVRSVVRALRNSEPDVAATDLAESARAEVAIAGELLGFAPTLELDGDLHDIPAALADHARAALRETLSNVVRHSGAHRVSVHIGRGAALELVVADDGCGIPDGVTHRGLKHLEERARQAGGRCDLRSSPSGTTVTWTVPLPG